MAASDNLGRNGFPKWLIAVLIGAPVTIGIGYYIIRKKKSLDDINSDENGTVKIKRKVESPVPKESSTDKSSQGEPVPQTPLERALDLKNKGNEFYKRSKYEDAIRCYTEAISVCPSNERVQLSMIYQNRAAAHEPLNNFEGVMEDCSRAIEMNPSYIKALSRRAKTAERLGQLRLGLEDVTALCILERFENISTLNHADRLLKKMGAELAKEAMLNKTPISPSVFFINSYLKTFVNDPIMDTPEGETPTLTGAKKAVMEGRLEDAIQASTERLAESDLAGDTAKSSEHYVALLLRSTALLLSGRPGRAQTDLSTIIDDNPPYPKIVVNAYVKRAALYLQLDELDKCLEDFAKAESIDPKNSDIFHQRAQVYLYSERLEEACEDYNKVVELSPEFGLGVLQRLYTKYRMAAGARDSEAMAAATAQLAAAAEKYPNVPEGFLLLGQVHADQTNFSAASKAFDRARQQNPQNANVLVHIGLLELQWQSNVEQAVQYLEEAIEVDCKCEFAYETLASIEVQRGNLMRAIELFSRALELAKCEKEMRHICALKAASEAQQVVAKRLNLPTRAGIRF